MQISASTQIGPLISTADIAPKSRIDSTPTLARRNWLYWIRGHSLLTVTPGSRFERSGVGVGNCRLSRVGVALKPERGLDVSIVLRASDLARAFRVAASAYCVWRNSACAACVDAFGAAVGENVTVGVALGLSAPVGDAVGDGVLVGLGVNVSVAVEVSVGVGDSVAVGVGDSVAVGVADGVAVGVADGVAVSAGVGVQVATTVASAPID